MATKRILVVDDEEMVCSLACRMLAFKGHTVFGANGGREALDMLKEQIPDLILSDIKMPDVGGFALLRAVRSLGYQMPFVGMSGHLRGEDGEEMDAFIQKPFRMQTLVDILGQALAGQPVA